MKEKIEKEIKELEELYDWNLKKSEDILYINNWDSIEKRLHDLKIEINIYKKVMNMIENNDKDKEIERLNNIINELENYIRARANDNNTCSVCSVMTDDLLNILKGSDKE